METRRQLLHMAVGAGALTLRWLTWPQAAALAVAAIAFNYWLLPRLFPQVLRPIDHRRSWTSGLVLYPVSVLALILIFRDAVHLTAAAWAVLAVGDGLATLVGVHVQSPALPWNRRKSTIGLVSFAVGGSLAALAALWFVAPQVAGAPWIALAILVATAAAFAETVPIGLDDNITVPAVAALILWSTQNVDGRLVLAHVAAIAGNPSLLVLLAVNAGAAWLGWRAGTVTGPGACTGAVIGSVMLLGAGAPGWLLLMATFIVASATTRLGHARKASAGIAEERGGRRGPGNAIANTGIAAWSAVVAAGLVTREPAFIALVAALSTSGSDTVASEVGKAFGRTTWQVTTGRRVARGTTGAVSLEGTLAGVVASVALAGLGSGVGLVPLAAVPVIAAASTLASLLEGVLGATLEARGMLTNDVVNFINSAMGAGLALLAWMMLA